MHIAYYSPAWPPGGAANGIVTYVSVIRDYLLRHGHEVSVLSDGVFHLSDGRSLRVGPAEPSPRFWPRMISRLDRRLGHHPFVGRAMADQLRRARALAPIDLVEMEETFGWSRTVQRRLGLPVVTRLHGPWFMKPAGVDPLVSRRHAHERERAEGRAICAAAALSAPSGTILAETCRRYDYRSDRTAVIPNPVVTVPAEAQWRLEACDRELILCVCRLDALKGADTMVAAFARLLRHRPDARLMMVGPDRGMQQPDGSVIPFLDHIRRVTDASVLARIAFAGMLPPEAIPALRRRAALTVVASTCENLPYAAVEAMVAGSPLISTDWVGSDEVVADGITGWLTPVGDADALAERMAWVFANPDEARQVAALAWRHGRETYSVDGIGARMVEFYRSVLARHPRA